MRVLCILALVLASAAALPGIQGKFIFPEAKADAYVEVRAKLRGLAATENRWIYLVCKMVSNIYLQSSGWAHASREGKCANQCVNCQTCLCRHAMWNARPNVDFLRRKISSAPTFWSIVNVIEAMIINDTNWLIALPMSKCDMNNE